MIETHKLRDEATLHGRGNLIVHFAVRRFIERHLIYKYFRLAQNRFMVHNGLARKPQACSSALSLTGVAYMWDGKKFEALEYRNEEQLDFTDDILHTSNNYF